MSKLNQLWGLITGADKKLKYPDQQARILGRVGNFTIIYPYGSHCDLPDNVLLFGVAEDAVIPVTVDRIDGIEQGEPVYYHPVKRSYITFRNDGSIEIDTDAAVNIRAAGNVNITAPLTTINGDLTVTGDTALAANVTSAGTDISNSHVHPENDSGGPTDPPV